MIHSINGIGSRLDVALAILMHYNEQEVAVAMAGFF